MFDLKGTKQEKIYKKRENPSGSLRKKWETVGPRRPKKANSRVGDYSLVASQP